jgi:hypothetical protein
MFYLSLHRKRPQRKAFDTLGEPVICIQLIDLKEDIYLKQI